MVWFRATRVWATAWSNHPWPVITNQESFSLCAWHGTLPRPTWSPRKPAHFWRLCVHGQFERQWETICCWLIRLVYSYLYPTLRLGNLQGAVLWTARTLSNALWIFSVRKVAMLLWQKFLHLCYHYWQLQSLVAGVFVFHVVCAVSFWTIYIPLLGK